ITLARFVLLLLPSSLSFLPAPTIVEGRNLHSIHSVSQLSLSSLCAPSLLLRSWLWVIVAPLLAVGRRCFFASSPGLLLLPFFCVVAVASLLHCWVNKKERKKVREVEILKKDPKQLKKQIENLEMMKCMNLLSCGI
ncbi:hypothetical protein S245_067267, partial [Arachis hypogaea]